MTKEALQLSKHCNQAIQALHQASITTKQAIAPAFTHLWGHIMQFDYAEHVLRFSNRFTYLIQLVRLSNPTEKFEQTT